MADIPQIIVNSFHLSNSYTSIAAKSLSRRESRRKEACKTLLKKMDYPGTWIDGKRYTFFELETTQEHKAVIKVLDDLNIYYALHYH